MIPIVKNAVRQSYVVTRNATSGAPITFANFAAESNNELARPRSFGGNQRAVAFEAAGKADALVSPIKKRTIYNSSFPCKKAKMSVKRLQIVIPILVTQATPNLSSKLPTGRCMRV